MNNKLEDYVNRCRLWRGLEYQYWINNPYGTWRIYDKFANKTDWPTLGIIEVKSGYYQDILGYAISLPNFWSHHNCGNIINEADIPKN